MVSERDYPSVDHIHERSCERTHCYCIICYSFAALDMHTSSMASMKSKTVLLSGPGRYSCRFVEKLPKKLKKTLKQKMVYCTYKSEGCKWTGKLQKHEEHKLSCQYKIRTCEFCREFQGTNEVVTVHKKSCPAATRYLPCPRKCGANIMAKNIEKHVQTRCPLRAQCKDFQADVPCTHCKVQVPRKELKEHTKT